MCYKNDTEGFALLLEVFDQKISYQEAVKVLRTTEAAIEIVLKSMYSENSCSVN